MLAEGGLCWHLVWNLGTAGNFHVPVLRPEIQAERNGSNYAHGCIQRRPSSHLQANSPPLEGRRETCQGHGAGRDPEVPGSRSAGRWYWQLVVLVPALLCSRAGAPVEGCIHVSVRSAPPPPSGLCRHRLLGTKLVFG